MRSHAGVVLIAVPALLSSACTDSTSTATEETSVRPIGTNDRGDTTPPPSSAADEPGDARPAPSPTPDDSAGSSPLRPQPTDVEYRDVIDVDVAFCEEFFDAAVGQSVSEVPAEAGWFTTGTARRFGVGDSSR